MASPVMAPMPPEGVVNLQIRGVPEELQKRLKARAAMEGLSLSDMLIKELTLIAERMSNAEMLRTLEAQEPVRLPENLVSDMVRTLRGEL